MHTPIKRRISSVVALLPLVICCVTAISLDIEVDSKSQSEYIIQGKVNQSISGVGFSLRKDGNCESLNQYNITAPTGLPNAIITMQGNQVSHLYCLPVLIASVLIDDYVFSFRFKFF